MLVSPAVSKRKFSGIFYFTGPANAAAEPALARVIAAVLSIRAALSHM